MDPITLEWGTFSSQLIRIALAYGLALPIGWEREQAEGSAGLRTFPLVAVASCGFALVAAQTFLDDPASGGRIIQGIITGMGFIGGGAILRHQGSVTGTATAASLWNTGAIGVSIALGRLDIALILSGLNLMTLRLLMPFKEKLDRRSNKH